ncbi:DUF397 domain-containing protein [Streptomyces roseochromogenus]|uniref:DUF397 domain-containing protein n=1 Tax=Streptomyces roseochromogenus subsp. oscitans DS 12.976 TaxID=1352936 RepID=V6K6W1_STRRC|nr:DUF397 domain-containing protein [Streptomyces roseochromogenus]EST27915.1 hypothetical protein M878_23855 [Streptomyces roseochromogenus subsp. oscitans DS 12.976]
MRNIPDYDLSAATWYKSSYSGGGGDDCLEVTRDFPALVPVRDSKTPQGPKLVFRPEAWSAFVENLRNVGA